MNITDSEKLGKEIVEYMEAKYKPLFPYDDLWVSEHRNILGGELALVVVKVEGTYNRQVLVWKNRAGELSYYISGETAIQLIAEVVNERRMIMEFLTGTQIVSVIILLLLIPLMLIVFLARGETHIDPLLACIFALVVGFYFGRGNNKS